MTQMQGAVDARPRRAPSRNRSGRLDAFVSSVIATLLVPLLPLLLERWVTENGIEENSWTIAAAMYAIAAGASATWFSLFWAYMMVSVGMSFVYGFTVAGNDLANIPSYLPQVCVSLVFLAHLGERFGLHVLDQKPFPAFKG